MEYSLAVKTPRGSAWLHILIQLAESYHWLALIDISLMGSTAKQSCWRWDQEAANEASCTQRDYRLIRISWGEYSLDCASGRVLWESAPTK